MIHVAGLCKHYRVHEKQAGLLGSVKSFVRRKYRLVKAVDDVSFDIASGEIVGFLGANGAGKTTTLKMLSGLLHPTAGIVRVTGFEPRRRQHDFLCNITLVMGQKQQLVWDLSAADSFLINQAIYGIPDDVYRRRVGELSEMLGLDGVLHKQVRKLSLGERMKCELVAAILHHPTVLFLDEPTIGLDINMQKVVRDFIAAYNERYQATVILTSHYMADVVALAKRILVINRGRLIFDGDLSILVEKAAPKKLLKLQFARPVSEADLAHFGEIRSHQAFEAELLVPRTELTRIASSILTETPIQDISIEEIPIEEIIAQVFQRPRKKDEA